MRKYSKSQSMLAYAALFGLVAAALIILSIYLKRSIQGRYRQSADVFGQGTQYQPGSTDIWISSSGGGWQ